MYSSVRRGRLGDTERFVEIVETESEPLDDMERARLRDWDEECCGPEGSLSAARPRSSSFLANTSSATPLLQSISQSSFRIQREVKTSHPMN